MPDISQLTLPSNFYESVSTKLLTTPVPMFVYAKGMLSALEKALIVDNIDGAFSGTGHGPDGATVVGAPVPAYDAPALNTYSGLLSDVFTTPVEKTFVGAPGTTIRFNRQSFDTTTYTVASRTVGDGDISTVPIMIKGEQVPLTLQLFGGPYDQVNGRIAPFSIDRFSSQVGVFKLTELTGQQMKYDFHRFLDAVSVSLLDLGAGVWPAGMTADDNIATVDGGALSFEQVTRAQQVMDDANLPTYGDGFRLLVVSPTGERQLKNDPSFIKYAQYFPELNALFPGYIKSVGRFHIVVSTTLSSTANTSSVPVYKAHAIAPGALGVASGTAPEVRASNQNDYGRKAKVIWLASMAFSLLDSRYVRTLRHG